MGGGCNFLNLKKIYHTFLEFFPDLPALGLQKINEKIKIITAGSSGKSGKTLTSGGGDDYLRH